jgi:hypothetical protein
MADRRDVEAKRRKYIQVSWGRGGGSQCVRPRMYVRASMFFLMLRHFDAIAKASHEHGVSLVQVVKGKGWESVLLLSGLLL